MAESAALEDTRVAEVVARLLARQSSLLARAADDEAAASAARLGLSWLADLMRSFDLNGAADWFQALRLRDDVPREAPGPTAAWAALGAPLCERLAGEVSRAGSIAPLGIEWGPPVGEVGAFEEPVFHDPSPPETPEIEPPAEPVVPPSRDPAPAPAPLEDPPPSKAPEIEPPADVLFEAIADFSAEETPAIDSSHGRIEITGTRALPDGGIDSASDVLLKALDRAARAAGAVLLVELGRGTIAWTVRLPKPEARHYLFVELGQAKVALPWNRVVEYGLAPGGERTRVVFGDGLERIELPVDWLFGKGEGGPGDDPVHAPAVSAPAPFTPHGWVTDLEGRSTPVIDLGPAPEPAAALPEVPEAVQPEPIPADIPPEIAAPSPMAIRALVADDSMMARVFLGRLLGKRGIVVEEAEDGAIARARLHEATFDLVFLDAEMPGAGALDLLRDVDERVRARACVLVKDDEERRRAEAFGGLPILYKPFAEDEVRSAVDALLAHAIPGS